MYALVIVLNATEYLDDILARFLDIGLKGATVLESQGMASCIVNHEIRSVPLFSYFKSLFDSSGPYNKTIFTVIESKELVELAINSVNEVMSDYPSEHSGLMFTVPIADIYSLGKI